ncbi:hypothetical protein PQR75_40825 [Paraburkholderia fungorum]|uniref:hypothetical protein n=1 Tax=Paraburkholderia fungorum TaxID=134537 RepID=UPI0038BB62EE
MWIARKRSGTLWRRLTWPLLVQKYAVGVADLVGQLHGTFAKNEVTGASDRVVASIDPDWRENGRKIWAAKPADVAPSSVDSSPPIEVRPVAELLDTRCGTALFGGSGVGKSTGLFQAFEQHVRNRTPHSGARHCLAVTYRDARWRALGEELRSKTDDFKLYDGEFDHIDETPSGIVFRDVADPTTLPRQILQWARAHAALHPVLIIDDGFVAGEALDEFSRLLPFSVTLIWSTASADDLPAGIMSHIHRIVVMRTSEMSGGRGVERIALDLGHPAVNAFGNASKALKPYQAIAYARAA